MMQSRRLSTVLGLGACIALAGAVPALAGSVSGRVVDPSGKPISGARVAWVAYRADDQATLDATRGVEPAVLGEIATGGDGAFRVVLDKPGTSVSLRISSPGSPGIRFGGPFDSSEDVALFEVHVPAGEKLSGRVVDDEAKPVSGARVRVEASDPFSDRESETVSETKTGADGTFSFADAPGGQRVLVARAAGFVPTTLFQLDPKPEARLTMKRGGVIRGVVLDPTGKPAAGALVLSEEQAAEADAEGAYRLSGVEAGVRSIQAIWKEDFAVRLDNVRVRRGQESEAALRLARASAITGAVVEESTRKPIAGAGVSASFGGLAFGRRRAERSARTDSRGKFRLGGLAPRPYAVSASRAGYLATSINGVAASPAAPGAVNLALARAASVAGKVVDEKGDPVAGAHVRLASDGGMRAMMRRGPSAILGGKGALSGPDGAFRLRNLAAGRNLSLEAGKAGYTPARRPGVTVKAGDAIANVSLVLKKGLEARGRVVDAQGKPVSGAEIRVAAREGGGGGFGGGRAQMRLLGMDASKPDSTSGPDGSFLLRGLEEGEYTATVSRDGYAHKTAPGLAVKASEENVWPPIALANGVAIAGFVRDSQAQPIANAQIFGISIGDAVRPQNASSDVDGRFRFDGLSADKPLLLNFSAPGYATAQKNVTAPAEDLAVVLKTAGIVRGRVEDGDTKRPINDFTVGRTGPRGGGAFMIDIATGRGGDKAFQSEDGSFELPDVPAGKWTIRAGAAGYRNGETSGVELSEGETKEGIGISLRRGGSLSGRVLDPRGGSLPNASVSWQAAGSSGGAAGAMFARFAGGSANTATTTDADGRFRFDGLPPGRVTLVADHADYLEGSRDVDPEKETSVDITLGTGGSITGSVVGRDGRTPVPGALVSLNQQGAAGMFGGADSARTDGSGAFLFEHLKPGRFKLSAQSGSGKSAPKDVILADNQRLDGVLIGMNPAGALVRGTVTGLPAGNLGGVRVFANGPDYGDSTQTDDSGTFTLKDVPAGVIRFQATTNFLSGRSASKSIEVPEGSGDVAVEIAFEGLSRLAGRVTRGDRPLTGLFVSANADPPQPGGGRANAQTDDDGRYALEGLKDGTYQLFVNGQGVSYRKTVAVSGDTTADVLIPAATITGTVTEEGSGDPIEGATIQADTGQETATFAMKGATTDSSGRYEIDGVDSGRYQVSARKAGYRLKTQTADVGSDPAQANFTLARGAGISIRVADGLMGMPLHGVTALAFGGDGGVAFQGSVSLDSTGKGEISSLGPGRYSIYLFSDGYAPRSLAAVDAPSPGVNVSMTPGGRVEARSDAPLTGRVLDASGAVYLLSPWRLDGRVNVSPPASTWEHFGPGSYTLFVAGPGGQRSYPFTVAEGQTTRLEVK